MSKLQFSFMGNFNTWDCFLNWLKSSSTNRSFTSLKLITAQVVIYSLWREKKSHIFTGIRTPAAGLFRGINRGIRNTCSARRHQDRFKDTLQLWFRDSLPLHFICNEPGDVVIGTHFFYFLM